MHEHEISTESIIGTLVLYLKGVYNQGIGHFDEALSFFRDPRFALSEPKATCATAEKQMHYDISILASVNTLLILQSPSYFNVDMNATLIQQLEPYCKRHADPDIRTAYSLLLSSINTGEPMHIHIIKTYLGSALQGAQKTSNAQFLCITFAIMCSRFYAKNVGPQAEKSALAASVAAKKSGSKVWMSVTDGLLARFYEGQGKSVEAENSFKEGLQLAQEALNVQ
jgi:Cohesin loading factor